MGLSSSRMGWTPTHSQRKSAEQAARAIKRPLPSRFGLGPSQLGCQHNSFKAMRTIKPDSSFFCSYRVVVDVVFITILQRKQYALKDDCPSPGGRVQRGSDPSTQRRPVAASQVRVLIPIFFRVTLSIFWFPSFGTSGTISMYRGSMNFGKLSRQ